MKVLKILRKTANDLKPFFILLAKLFKQLFKLLGILLAKGREALRIFLPVLRDFCVKAIRMRSVQVTLAVLALILLCMAVFFSRKPVILVSDAPFELLYGETQSRVSRLTASLSVFRQIMTIQIAEGAGPDMVAQAAASLSKRPKAVFFPYRYRDGARRYLTDHPGVPTAVLGGRFLPEGDNPVELRWFCTDINTDMYRAGLLAGEIALQSVADDAGQGMEEAAVGLFQEKIDEEAKNAFKQGLQKQGWEAEPAISPDSGGLGSFVEQLMSCIVMARRGDSRFYDGPGAVILLTWANPAFMPERTAAFFDDSPWAQLVPGIKLLINAPASPKTDDFSLIPSKCTIFKHEFGEKKGTHSINQIKTLRYFKKNTDN